MGELFSVRVASEAWRNEAHAWIEARLAEVGRGLTGEIEQRRIRPWATQLVVPTDRGTVWFKANCPELAHEVAVHETLSQLVPDEVDVPLAVDAERGWMMTADRGMTLGDSHEATLEDWQAVVQLAATLQRRVERSGDRLLRAGLPDCSPPTVVARYGWLVDQLEGLPSGHPSHLTAQEAQSLRARSDTVAEAVEVLVAAPLPATLQHGDLHPRNVFAVDGGMRIFDFGDSQWAHPLEVLAVPYGYASRVTPMPWQPLLEAYAAVWADVVDVPTVESLLPSAMVAQAVNRSFLWLGAVVGAQEHELAEWGDSPVYYLRLVHEPFAPKVDDPD
jgi:hypothetical protein